MKNSDPGAITEQTIAPVSTLQRKASQSDIEPRKKPKFTNLLRKASRLGLPTVTKDPTAGGVPGSTDVSDRFNDIQPEIGHRHPPNDDRVANSEKSALRPPGCFEIQLQTPMGDSEPGACQDQLTSPISTMG